MTPQILRLTSLKIASDALRCLSMRPISMSTTPGSHHEPPASHSLPPLALLWSRAVTPLLGSRPRPTTPSSSSHELYFFHGLKHHSSCNTSSTPPCPSFNHRLLNSAGMTTI